MDALVALALSIGILIAGWTYLALGVAALPVWAGIVAWGSFFAAGGKTQGLAKTIAANLSGVLWAFLALHLWLDGETTLQEAHATSHVVKDRLMTRFPELADVVIHIEPPPLAGSK